MESPQVNRSIGRHLFELQGEEAVALRADRHTGEVRQRDAGLHLTRLLVGQDEAVLGQQEDSGCSLVEPQGAPVNGRISVKRCDV